MSDPSDDAPLTPRGRRFRPGRGSSGGWSPFLSSSSAAEDVAEDLEREVAILERVLQDKGDLPRKELGQLAGCRYWGPGRFSGALRAGLDQGRIRKVGRARYGV
jgi:hypothetical protein